MEGMESGLYSLAFQIRFEMTIVLVVVKNFRTVRFGFLVPEAPERCLDRACN